MASQQHVEKWYARLRDLYDKEASLEGTGAPDYINALVNLAGNLIAQECPRSELDQTLESLTIVLRVSAGKEG